MSSIPDEKLFQHSARVKGCVVVITGAAKGIGRQTAKDFASRGAKIVIGDTDVSGAQNTALEIVKDGGEAVSCLCDVTIWDHLVSLYQLALDTYGAVDVVIANAGVTEVGDFGSLQLDKDGKPLKPANMLTTLNVNLIGLIQTLKLAHHYLRLNRTGDTLKAVVILGSMASWSSIPTAPMYSAAKHAALGLMRSLHLVWERENIRIGIIHPFFADTTIVPPLVKLALAGIPKAPVSRIAGAIFYAATEPTLETNGCAWLLLDDGPVFLVPREEFKMGVYAMVDKRANRLLKGVDGVVFYTRFFKDLIQVLWRPTISLAVAVTAAKFGWKYLSYYM
ncbi:hypothetical protein C8J56DRAFT_821152 [Mycena floridula]|nr:hypothetical protein C8J56DRAFT_821152 [Mycena floridula]